MIKLLKLFFSKRFASQNTALPSQHLKVVSGFLLVSLFVFLGKAAGAAKEMAVAWRYGVNEIIDAYAFVFNLISWPISVWFSVIMVVLVPLLSKIRNENPDELPRFRGELLGLTALIGAVMFLLLSVCITITLKCGWTGLTGPGLHKAVEMALPLSIIAFFGSIISVFSALLLAAGKHRNTLFEAIPSLVLLCALLAPRGWVPQPLLWGTILGFVLHMIALALPVKRSGELQAPRIRFDSPAWTFFWRGVGPMVVGQALISFTGIIDQLFASHLGSGSVATYNYANRILSLVLTLGATAIARATLPVFSETYATGDKQFSSFMTQWAGWMLKAGVVVFVIGWLLSPFIVQLLFERGAFTGNDTKAVAGILRYGLIQVPFYYTAIIFTTQLSSRRIYMPLMKIGICGLFIKCASTWVLIRYLDLGGIMLASSVMYMINLLLLYRAVK